MLRRGVLTWGYVRVVLWKTSSKSRKTYGILTVVADVSFSVRKGDIRSAGPNGAGKTTTVECLKGLRRADGGNIKVLDLNPATGARALKQMDHI